MPFEERGREKPVLRARRPSRRGWRRREAGDRGAAGAQRSDRGQRHGAAGRRGVVSTAALARAARRPRGRRRTSPATRRRNRARAAGGRRSGSRASMAGRSPCQWTRRRSPRSACPRAPSASSTSDGARDSRATSCRGAAGPGPRRRGWRGSRSAAQSRRSADHVAFAAARCPASAWPGRARRIPDADRRLLDGLPQRAAGPGPAPGRSVDHAGRRPGVEQERIGAGAVHRHRHDQQPIGGDARPGCGGPCSRPSWPAPGPTATRAHRHDDPIPPATPRMLASRRPRS